jgi:hypothetical protein
MAVTRQSTSATLAIPTEEKVGTEQGVATDPQLPSEIIKASAEAPQGGGPRREAQLLVGRSRSHAGPSIERTRYRHA